MWTIPGNVPYLATDTTVSVVWSLVAICEIVNIKEVPLRQFHRYVVSWTSKPFASSDERGQNIVCHLPCHTSAQVVVQVKWVCKNKLRKIKQIIVKMFSKMYNSSRAEWGKVLSVLLG